MSPQRDIKHISHPAPVAAILAAQPGPSRRAVLHTTNLALAAAAMAALPSIAGGAAHAMGLPPQSDPLPALVARFLPIHSEYWAIGADLNARYAQELQLGHEIVPTYKISGKRFHEVDELRDFFDTLIADVISNGAEFFGVTALEARRAHFVGLRDFHVLKFENYRKEWRTLREETGLAKLEAEHADAERRLDEVEAQIRGAVPQSLAGVIAMLQYALAYATNKDEAPEDQPAAAKAIAAALAFLEHGAAS